MYCLLKGKATIDMVLGMGKSEMLPKKKLDDVVVGFMRIYIDV